VIHQRVNNVHWNYLLALDADTAVVARYVEFNPANYNTYSIELARLLMAAAAEVDVVAKIACSRVNPATTAGNIEEYRLELVPARPNLPGYPIQINRFGLDFEPWINWSTGTHPDWWRAYNAVKHERNNEYAQANLKNALNAVAGLYVMLIYAFPDEARAGSLAPMPGLFSVPETKTDGYIFDPAGTLVEYLL
jgi:hypothetical protein